MTENTQNKDVKEEAQCTEGAEPCCCTKEGEAECACRKEEQAQEDFKRIRQERLLISSETCIQ